MTARIYAVLEPVHWLLRQVDSVYMQRRIAREAGRQLQAGMDADRLQHRLTVRFAGVSPTEIRDPGRWLLGVGLPRWGCGHLDCEAGVMWSTGRRCDVCAEVVADKFAARQRAQRVERGLCPEHSRWSSPSGGCGDCEIEHAIETPAAAFAAAREPEGPPRGTCGDCGCKIFLVGRALADGLCKLCREQAEDAAQAEVPVSQEQLGPVTCTGWDGVPCTRLALPTRTVCARHRAQELAAEKEAS